MRITISYTTLRNYPEYPKTAKQNAYTTPSLLFYCNNWYALGKCKTWPHPLKIGTSSFQLYPNKNIQESLCVKVCVAPSKEFIPRNNIHNLVKFNPSIFQTNPVNRNTRWIFVGCNGAVTTIVPTQLRRLFKRSVR